MDTEPSSASSDDRSRVRRFDVAAVWSRYADDVRPVPIEADHYVAEENPAATLAALRRLWADAP